MKQSSRVNVYVQLGIIGFLLLSACAPASTPSAKTAPSQEPVSTQTETPILAPEATERSGPSFTNPVYSLDFPDPHVILVDDTYYAYATTNGSSINIRVMSSPDLLTWEEPGDALPAMPKWAKLNSGFTWAPGVMEIEDQFVMYYVARDKAADLQCIGRAVSDVPSGPFLDPDEQAFICQTDLGGSIDAYPFRDDDGRLYLFWKNDGTAATWKLLSGCRNSAPTA